MTLLRIGELAKRSGLGIETIRFYERKGLLDEPERRPSGYRQYDETVIARLLFIRRTKSLGFTLVEIKELLTLWFSPHTGCHHVREKAAQKLVEIDERLKSLKEMKRSLKKLTEQCQQRDSVEACPLFDGLSDVLQKQPKQKSKTSIRRRR